jgi:hypothetical protein
VIRKEIIVGVVAVAAVFAGVLYYAKDAGKEPSAASAPDEQTIVPEPKPLANEQPTPVARAGTPARPVTSDPRLAALMVSPANALIEFVPDADGRVIKEIDKDPASPGYKKPLREYMYAGDKVVGLTSYKYLGGQVQVVRVMVTYKPDGSVDKYMESTDYDFGKKVTE